MKNPNLLPICFQEYRDRRHSHSWMHWKSTTWLKWEGLCGERRVCFPGNDSELGSLLQEIIRSPPGPSWRENPRSWKPRSVTQQWRGSDRGSHPPEPRGWLCFAVWGLMGSCTQALAHDCFLSLCVRYSFVTVIALSHRIKTLCFC